MSEASHPGQSIRGAHLVPMVIFLAASMIMLWCFLLYLGLAERDQLMTTIRNQELPLQYALNLRIQMDSLATATEKLADQGDRGAKQVLESMYHLGIRPVESFGLWQWNGTPQMDAKPTH
jgi:hypothetical protein